MTDHWARDSGPIGIVPRACFVDLVVGSLCPGDELGDRIKQRLAERRKTIFDAGWAGGKDMSRYQPVALEIPTSLGQHAFGDIRHGTLERAEAAWLSREHD